MMITGIAGLISFMAFRACRPETLTMRMSMRTRSKGPSWTASMAPWPSSASLTA